MRSSFCYHIGAWHYNIPRVSAGELSLAVIRNVHFLIYRCCSRKGCNISVYKCSVLLKFLGYCLSLWLKFDLYSTFFHNFCTGHEERFFKNTKSVSYVESLGHNTQERLGRIIDENRCGDI